MESAESAGSGSGSGSQAGVGPGFCRGPVSSPTHWVWFVSMQTMFWLLVGPRGSVLQNPGPDWRGRFEIYWFDCGQQVAL